MQPTTLYTLSILLLTTHLIHCAYAEIIMVYSMQRHGARHVLPKTSTLQENDAQGGPALLPQGAAMAHTSGLQYQARYLNGSTCGSTCLAIPSVLTTEPYYGVINETSGIFNSFNTVIRSSGLDRTISTARAFLDGVFPPITDQNIISNGLLQTGGEQIVPIYSIGEDPLIRAYTQCPAYVSKLDQWYNSDEFKAKEAETNGTIRATVHAIDPTLNVSLANWFNVFDEFDVYRTYNVGQPMPAVDNTTFAEMEDLANWLETGKMQSYLTENFLGGLILSDLISKLEYARVNYSLPSTDRLIHISGHYNVLLGVLGALKVDQMYNNTTVPWLFPGKIPELAAIMAFELFYNDTDAAGGTPSFAVRLVMQDGNNAGYQTIPLPCSAMNSSINNNAALAEAGTGACSLDDFLAMYTPQSFNSTESWCTACNNTVYPQCTIGQLQNALQKYSETTNQCNSNAAGWQIAVAVILPALTVAAIAAFAFIIYKNKLERRYSNQQQAMDSQLISKNQQEYSV